MRKNKRSEYQQGCNAQAAVDAQGSRLVSSTRVSQCASDRNELVAVGSEVRRRRHDFRPARELPVAAAYGKGARGPLLVKMKETMAQAETRAVYRLRKQTVEPVFGVVKQAMGFRQFLLRGEAKVAGEWQLPALAHNCKRLRTLMQACGTCRPSTSRKGHDQGPCGHP